MRISDTRLFKIMKHIQTLSLPQSKRRKQEETELWTAANSTQETFEAIETLTKENKSDEFKGQVTHIEANFELSKVIINTK
jgi:hypothetical protein